MKKIVILLLLNVFLSLSIFAGYELVAVKDDCTRVIIKLDGEDIKNVSRTNIKNEEYLKTIASLIDDIKEQEKLKQDNSDNIVMCDLIEQAISILKKAIKDLVNLLK